MKIWPFRKKAEQDKQRAALRLARKTHETAYKTLQIIPPEGVPLDLRLATISGRAAAQLTDLIVTVVAAVLFMIVFAFSVNGSGSILTIVFTLTLFFLRIPYYVLTELLWDGRTLAKRWLGLRVISLDGRSLTAHQIVVRNLMKEIEFFIPFTVLIGLSRSSFLWVSIALVWVVILLIIPVRSKRNQRLGDFIANTAVIEDPTPVMLQDLTTSSDSKRATERFPFTTQQLDHYGKFELEVLEKVLRAPPIKDAKAFERNEQYLADIVDRITKKINYEEAIDGKDKAAFLSAFYTAQRAHLEVRKLFGDTREDKFFNDDLPSPEKNS